MPESASSRVMRVVGVLSLVVGAAVFLIRLQHAGPYAMPAAGNLRAGLLALAIGAWLVHPWFGAHRLARIASWVLLAISPVVLFFALYSTLAELEEVVVLQVVDANDRPANLRLWIVDDEGAAWVTMPARKAAAHGLDDADVSLLRDGEVSCVHVTRIDDRERVARTHGLRHEKYAVQRLATRIGLFSPEPNPTTVTLRLDPCAS